MLFTFPKMPPIKNGFASVVNNTYIARETRSLILCIENPEFYFSAGQFINIKIKEKVIRAYSISSCPFDLPEVELCVKIIPEGQGSTYIDHLKEGELVEFMGPFGHFGTQQKDKSLVLIATGTGIAPMKSIIDEQKEHHFPRKTLLIYGVRDESFAAYDEYFKNLEEKYENFSYNLYVSRPNDSYVGKKGRVTQGVQDIPFDFFKNTEVLICGNPAMVKEVKSILIEEKSVLSEDIVIEMY